MRTALLAASLVTNLTLIGWIGWNHTRHASGYPSTPGPTPGSVAPIVKTASKEAARVSDRHSLATKLAVAGLPKAAVNGAILAIINEEFAARRRALLPTDHGAAWTLKHRPAFEPKKLEALRALRAERNQSIRDAGITISDEDTIDRLGGIAPEKVDPLLRILADYAELRSTLNSDTRGILLNEDREKQLYLEQQQRQDVAALLTPDELTNYELKNSVTATTLRAKLAILDPTEEEFRAIFKLQRAFDIENGANPVPQPTTEQAAKRRSAQERLDHEVEQLLGGSRYADYRLATDPAMEPTNRVLARFQLPLEVGRQAAQVQKDALAQLSQINAQRLQPAQRNARLSALQSETDTRLAQILGPQAIDAYKQVNVGWLSRLRPRG